jgi:hypothetical protein
MTADSLELNFKAVFAIDFLFRKTEALEKVLISISDKTKDLPTAEKLKELSDLSMKLSQIDIVMDKISGRLEKGEQVSEKTKNSGKEPSSKYVS